MRALVLFSLWMVSLWAATGDAAIFILKDGKPLAHVPITIDHNISVKTDKDGSAFVTLSVGKHQAVIDIKEQGKSIAFARHNFIVAPNEETEVIVTLSQSGRVEHVEVDESQEAQKYLHASSLNEKKQALVTLKGHIFSKEHQRPLSGVRLFVKGSSAQAVSDKKGYYKLRLKRGKVTVTAIHDKYATLEFTLSVKDKPIEKNLNMQAAGMELEEFVVLKPKLEGSVASAIAEVKNSDTVGDVLGSEQFSKSGDSSAAAALKRVSGITIVGGKYVYIRGLGERYSTIMFNDLYIPSPEPTKRVVPLDIFPTSVIGSMKIQKSYSADIPGSFGGGAVLIRSKDIPKESYVEMGLSFKSSNKTGRKVMTNSDNSKGLPDAIIAASNNFKELAGDSVALTKEAANYRSYNHEERSLAPSYGLSFAAGESYHFNNGWDLGFTASVFYDHEEDVNDIRFNKYVFASSQGGAYLESSASRQVAEFNDKIGAFLTLALDTNSHSKAKYTMLYLYDASDTTTTGLTTGLSTNKELTYYEYVKKQLFINQFNSEHKLQFAKGHEKWLDDMIIKLSAEYGIATRYEPGTVEYTYNYYAPNPYLDQKTWYLYSNLFDSVINARADFTLPFKLNEQDNATKFGGFFYYKARTLDNRRYKMQHYFSAQSSDVQTDIDSIFTTTNATADDIRFSSNYRTDDSYIALQSVIAGYASQSLSLLKNLDITLGARYELSNQQLIDSFSGEPYDPLNTSNILPALGATYRITDSMQVRAGYSTTLSRPDFREFSPNRFKDPITGNIIFGYPELKSTTIDNMDVKFEWYFSDVESFSVALFNKNFTNPIEQINVIDTQSDGAVQLVSYRNALSASSSGYEIDLRKRFGFLGAWGESILFASNYSVIHSTIKLNYDSSDVFLSQLTTTTRAMQGQSPYVMNVQFGYDDTDTGNSALLLFNQIGARIVAIGTYGNEDEYEQPFAKLDFVAKYKLEMQNGMEFGLKFKASNILDSEVVIKKGADITKTYKPGQWYNLSLNFKF